MSNDNGQGRILLHNRRPMGKGGDFVTRTELEQLVTAECAKVHEYYLAQIPKFTAKMIQDALVAYGLLTIVPPPATDAPAVPENAGVEASPADSVTPAESLAEVVRNLVQSLPEAEWIEKPAGTPCGTEPSAEPRKLTPEEVAGNEEIAETYAKMPWAEPAEPAT